MKCDGLVLTGFIWFRNVKWRVLANTVLNLRIP
jgi:hypothetical protein